MFRYQRGECEIGSGLWEVLVRGLVQHSWGKIPLKHLIHWPFSLDSSLQLIRPILDMDANSAVYAIRRTNFGSNVALNYSSPIHIVSGQGSYLYDEKVMTGIYVFIL